MDKPNSIKFSETLPAILIVDDHLSFTDAMRRTLMKYARVLVANDGHTGLKIARSQPDLNLIVLDVTMPEYDAVELLRDMAKENIFLPVIIISGGHRNILRIVMHYAETLDFKVVSIFEKPFDVKKIVNILTVLVPT